MTNQTTKIFCSVITSLQYKVVLAITGTIRESTKEKLNQELGFEYLSSGKWLK